MSGVPSSRVNASRFRKGTGSFVHVRRDDPVEEAPELCVRECDTIEGFELFPEVCFKRGSITDIGAIFVLEIPQPGDQGLFKIAFGSSHRHRGTHCFLAITGRGRLPGVKWGKRAEAVLRLFRA